MSEKTRKTETVENLLEMAITKPNKQKHNSKRRRSKKNKTPIATQDGSDLGKLDEVVDFLCYSISKNESEASLGANIPVKMAKESPKAAVLAGENHKGIFIPNTVFQSPPSSQDLSGLFENLQVHASRNPMKSNNVTDFVNIELLKKNISESQIIKDLEKINLEKLMKEEKTCIPSQNLKEYLNFSMLGNFVGSSVNTRGGPSSSQLVIPTERTHNFNLPRVDNKDNYHKYIEEYYKYSVLADEKNTLVTTIKSTSKVLSKEPQKTLVQSETSSNNKKFHKRKTESKKTSAPTGEDQVSTWNQRVFLNSDLQKNHSSEETTSNSPQHSKTRKKQNPKSSSTENDTKFSKYLTSEELQCLSNSGVLLTGIIRINQKNYKEAYITAPDKGMDILIEGLKDRNRALEGDEVFFVLKSKEHHRVSTDSLDSQRTAVVVGIKSYNHNRGAIGSLNVMTNKNNTFALFSPRDSRLPRIRIRKNNWPQGFAENSKSFKDKLYFAKISQWSDLRYADGELVNEVGLAGDLESETKAILMNYGLDVTPYSENLKQFIPPVSFKISDLDMSNREDRRKNCIFTIDPASAVDLDDALGCRLLPNGNYEVELHISDVSYFLEEGTPLDKSVSERATTVYLVQKAYHMLPYELCQLCSLSPGEDRLSFSVMWEITPECQILNHRYARSVINSCAQLTYSQVQAMLDNVPFKDISLPKIHGGHTSEKIKDIVMFLNKVAVYLRNKRFSSGALRIDQKKIYFSLDENKLPVAFEQHIREPSHELIEEFMLLANTTVAETLNSVFPKLAFLRTHPPPLPHILEKLQKTFEKYGIIVNISSSNAIQETLSKYSGEDKESIARMLVLNNALAKPMARAKYYCGGLFSDEIDRRHYALNVPLYTHFTSPIRRYADVMVHRLLAASLNYRDVPKWTTDYVQSIAANCNKQKYAAKMAQEMSTELYLALYINQHVNMACEAVVCDIKDRSFDCIVLSTGMHQRVYFEHIKGDVKQKKEDGIIRLKITWPKSEDLGTETIQIIEMFSIVKIELKKVGVLKIEAKLLPK